MTEYKLLVGDCVKSMRSLPDKSVHCCVTSPPYYGLRDYGVAGQIGLEETPESYIAKMVEVFREVWRVLRDDGTLWLNIGDSYSNVKSGGHGYADGRRNREERASAGLVSGVKQKDLIGIPWMLAFALRADGWYLRQDIIWHKPNPMPESVRDRCTKAHEYIFLLSKSQKYFFKAAAIEEPAKWERWGNQTEKKSHQGTAGHLGGKSIADLPVRDKKNKRSVWTIPTKPYKGAHFAAFPPALIGSLVFGSKKSNKTAPHRWRLFLLGAYRAQEKIMPIDPDQNRLNQERLAHPVCGDFWQEMMIPYFIVVANIPEGIVICQRTMPAGAGRYKFDLAKSELADIEWMDGKVKYSSGSGFVADVRVAPDAQAAALRAEWESLGSPFTPVEPEPKRLLPHQQRVVKEKAELYEKAKKLSQFIGTSQAFDKIDAEEQELLKAQADIMRQYSEILEKRIAAFI